MNPRTALAAVGAVALLVGGLAGYLYGIDSTPRETTTELSTVTVSTSASAYDQVAESFADHMLFLSERNATAIASQYTGNGTVYWYGVLGVGGLAGFYNSTRNILTLMRESFIGNETSFAIGNVTRTIAVTSANSAVVNSTFDVCGQGDYIVAIPGSLWSAFNATVSARDSYVYSASENAWLISNETWDFTNFNTQPIG
ncbi:MAG: hypothetical protein JRN09_09420 [Nitrososphaerota archaeon]|nr:hypothetical protein [Nitrososphaerota archaeon]